MNQLRSYADDRLVNGCIYCGGPEETRDHVPSRVFLDSPFPENLPVVWACCSCNNSFSRDEEYVACLIESIIAGSADPDRIRRPGVAAILRRAPALRARIEAAKTVKDGRPWFDVEAGRVGNVILKLAIGHAAYELSQIRREKPRSVRCSPLGLMTEDEKDSFDSAHFFDIFPEVGSTALQRTLVLDVKLQSAAGGSKLGLLMNDWLEVQEGRYRYLAIDDVDGVTIKMVLGDFLACEVNWTR